MQNTPARKGEGVDCQLGGDNAPYTIRNPSRQQKWAQSNPKAVWAQAALRSAVRRGLIEREPCEECGAETVDGHHDDYDKPMAVRWLCRRHHRALHANGGGK